MGEVRGETERKQGEEEVEGGRGEVEESGERVKLREIGVAGDVEFKTEGRGCKGKGEVGWGNPVA